MKPRDFERYLKLDRNDLDQANIEQPELVWHATEAQAEANAKLAALDRDKANLSAELSESLQARAVEDGEKTRGSPGVSQATLARRVRDHKDMRELNEEWLVAKKESDLWAAMVESLRTRGKSLQNLGGLYAANYFERETSGKMHRDEMQANADKVHQARSTRPARRTSN